MNVYIYHIDNYLFVKNNKQIGASPQQKRVYPVWIIGESSYHRMISIDTISSGVKEHVAYL